MPAEVLPPDEESLRLFLLGRLSGPEAEAVERFLESAPDAARTLDALAGEDTFTSSLRGLPDPEPVAPEVEATMTILERLVAFDPDRTEALAPADDALGFLAPPDRPGDLGRIGGYRAVSILGVGGMGTVLEAEDPKLGRRVALKVMRPQPGGGTLATARFVREARAAAAFAHDHIVPVFHVGEENGVPFLVMPLLRGESLDARLKREGRLPVAEVTRIGREMAEGLAAAHAAGLVHRDIKPANVWLEAPGGRVKLLDFGLARGTDSGITQPGVIIGTPAYMAPEQARGQAVDPRADLFSLGAVLYRCATGRAPFTGPDTFSVLTSLAVDTPPALRTLNPEVPPAVAGLITQLLQKDPARRPPAAAAVSRLLSEAPAAPPRPGRMRWLAAAAALAGAIVIGVAGYTIQFGTPHGTFVVEVADDHEVTTKFKDGRLQILDADGKVKYTLTAGRASQEVAPGRYKFRVEGADGLHVETGEFEIKKGETRTVRVTLAPPAVAKADPPKVEPKKAEPKAEPKKADPEPKPGDIYKPDDAMKFPGQTVTIRGKVSRVRVTNQGKNIFLDFEGPDRHQILKVLVFKDELDAHFEHLPQKLVGSFSGKYVGQWIQVTGQVTVRKLDAFVRPATKGPFKFAASPPDDRPLDPAWAEATGGLAGPAQVTPVVAELKRRNPGYDGAANEQYRADGAVIGIEFSSAFLFDLRPLAVFDELERLSLVPQWAEGKLADLRPLAGLHLKSLNLAGNPRITDLKPLRDLPLVELNLSATGVTDLSPLSGVRTLKRLHLPQPTVNLKPLLSLSLTDLTGVFDPRRDRDALKAFPDLKTIDGKPAAEFWKK